MAMEVLEMDDEVGDGLLVKLPKGIELTNDLALRNTLVKKLKEHRVKLVKSCEGGKVELGLQPRHSSVKSQPKLCDFWTHWPRLQVVVV